MIEYYWDCIPVIGLRPESVHTRNELGAAHMQRYIDFLVWQNPTLHRNDLWRPFRSSYIRRFSRNGQIRESQFIEHSRRLQAIKNGNLRQISQILITRRRTRGFLSGVERKHKNKRTATRQRATLHNGVARCVFSSPRCARFTRFPWTKAQTYSHLARRFLPTPHATRSPID